MIVCHSNVILCTYVVLWAGGLDYRNKLCYVMLCYVTDSDCNVGEERKYRHKSYKETRVFFFIIPTNKFNVQFI